MPRTAYALALFLIAPAALADHDDGPVSVSIEFRATLGPHGRWMRDDEYGWVWLPTRVSADWRPYSEGRWVWTTSGWSWDCDEPWGRVVFHYGRWAYRPAFGWLWIPGDEWAPAWVVWNHDAGHIGWAPLGPRRVWATHWVWQADRDFGRPQVHVRRAHSASWTRPSERHDDDRGDWRPPPPRQDDDKRGHGPKRHPPRGRTRGHRH